jgi:hypothetical protein
MELRSRELSALNGVDAMGMAHLMRVDFPLLSPKQTEPELGSQQTHQSRYPFNNFKIYFSAALSCASNLQNHLTV